MNQCERTSSKIRNTKMNASMICLIFLLLLMSSSYAEIDSNSNIRRGIPQKYELLTHKKIVGGEETVPGRYSYQVGLLYLFDETPFCGGTLIHPEWVLTAGHCIGYAYRVQIGRYDINDPLEDFEEYGIDFKLRHPSYSWFDYDFGLIKLSRPSNYTAIKLDDGTARLASDTNFTTIGWGTTSSGGELSDTLREVEVDFLSNIFCSIIYMLYPFGYVSQNMLCARRRGKDSCQGDSGGPLIIKGQNATEDIQVGIVSWGVGCANPLFPGVYARVSSAMDFIRDHVPI